MFTTIVTYMSDGECQELISAGKTMSISGNSEDEFKRIEECFMRNNVGWKRLKLEKHHSYPLYVMHYYRD